MKNGNAIKKTSAWQYILKYRWLYLFMLPALLTVLVFNYLPMWGTVMAFQEFDPILRWSSPFVGLDNFRSVFNDPLFGQVMRNTLAISGLGFLIGFPMPIIVAIFINEIALAKFKRFVQTVSYLPHFISWVVVAGIMYEFLGTRGLINNIVAGFGFEPVDFFAEPQMFWVLSVLIAVWKELGWQTIIYLAAITGINQELYEAAAVDGAGRFKRIWHITLPGIKPTIALMLILEAGKIFTGAGISPGFDGVFNLSNYVLLPYARTLDYYVYERGIYGGSYSFTAAMGLMLAVINLVLVFSANKAANKVDDLGII